MARTAVAALLVVGLVLGYGWSLWTRPLGEQAVEFVPAQQDCADVGPLRYCVHRAAGGVNGDVVYHLHGRNLEPEVWNDPSYFTAMVQAYWQREKMRPPTVITLSYGPTWLLTPKGEAPSSGLLEAIWPHISAIEARLGRPTRRLLLGESMGGLNVLVLGMSQPQRFAKVAALCPGLYVDSPFASFTQIKAALERTGAEPRIAFGIWMLARRYVARDEEWQRSSPLAMLDRFANEASKPSLYLSGGLYDRYGNFEGTQRFATRGRELGLNLEWHPLYGGHCAIDIPSLAAFLTR